MNIYLIGMYENVSVASVIKAENRFAHFSATGTWVDDGGRCDHCGWHGQDMAEPLIVEWEPSSDIIGDFSWGSPTGGYTFILTERVAGFFQQNKIDCDFLSVSYAKSTAARKAICVSFPYNGPRQFWGKCNKFVDLDMDASRVRVRSTCDECGRIIYSFIRRDIIIKKNDWQGEEMFRITTNGNSLATFVTEDCRRMIEDEGFTNIAFSLAGEIID